MWGKHDPFFLEAGARAFRRDVNDAEIMLLDGGHFALEEHAATVAAEICRVFGSRTGLDRVTQFYAELAGGHVDEALGLLASDISWNDPKGFPYGGSLAGTGAVKEQVFARLGAEWSTFSVVPDTLIPSADGAYVIAVGRYGGRNRATDRSLDAPFAHVWSIASGKVVRFETFTDTTAFHEAIGQGGR